MIAIIFLLAIVVFAIASMWKTFVKAGQPGYAAIIPIYNIYVMTQIAKKPTWWIAVIILVPIVNIVFIIMTLNGVSKAFGKDEGFTVGLVLLGIVFWGILGFGDAKYLGAEKEVNDEILDL